MTFAEGRGASTLDDPDYPLRIQTSGDYNGWRSGAAKKEPWTYEWLKTIGMGRFYDVGACVGSYSLMAAARGARVIAIEPVPANASECVANALLNGLDDKITVLSCAAGKNSNETILFASPAPGFGLASQDHRSDEQTERISVPTRTLVDIAIQHGLPTHIKIDVEGAEKDVVSGAGYLLDTVQSVICEIKNDDNEAWILRVMRGRGLESVWDGGRRTEQERTHVFRRAK